MLRAWAGGWAATEWPGLVAAIEDFLEPDRESADAPVDLLEPLTGRELEVLRIAAEGLSNQAIAERLTLSPRTIERHLSNAYRKLGVSGKSARAAAVAHVLSR